MPALTGDTDDLLDDVLLNPAFIFLDAVLAFLATLFSAWSLLPSHLVGFKVATAACNFTHAFITGPLAEASIRKRQFQAAETRGVWGYIKRQSEALYGTTGMEGDDDGKGVGGRWQEFTRFLSRMWLFWPLLLPLDNLWGLLKFLNRLVLEKGTISSEARYTALFDLSTFIKRSASIAAGVLALVSLHLLDPKIDIAIQILNISAVLTGKLASLFAELAKHGYDATNAAIALRA